MCSCNTLGILCQKIAKKAVMRHESVAELDRQKKLKYRILLDLRKNITWGVFYIMTYDMLYKHQEQCIKVVSEKI